MQPLMAQVYDFEKIGLEQGLPSKKINDILRDDRGFYWLATEGTGLVRFDGYNYVSLASERFPLVNKLALDTAQNVWFSTEKSLIRYDGDNYRSYHLPKGRRLNDFAAGQNIWAADAKGTVYRLTHDSLRTFQQELSYVPRVLLPWKNKLLVATDSGLYRLEKESAKKLTTQAFSKLQSTEGGRLLALADSGLYASEDLQNWRMIKRGRFKDFVWNGKEMALLAQDTLYWQQGKDYKKITVQNGLPEAQIFSIFLDKAGLLWLNPADGLYKWSSQAKVTYPLPLDQSLNSVASAKGEVWGATQTGIYRLDGKPEKIFSELTLSLAFHRGQLFAGTERGLFVQQNGRFRKVYLPGLSSNFVFSLYSNGESLWVGSGTGLYCWKNGKGINLSRQEDLPSATVFSISEGRDQSLWFGTYTRGFFRYHDGVFEHITELGGMALDSIRFSSFKAESAEEIWLGTLNDGLYHISNKQVQHITFAQLDYAEVRSIQTDSSDNFWVGTNKGLFRLSDAQLNNPEGHFHLNFMGKSNVANVLEVQGDQLLAGAETEVVQINLNTYEKSRPPLQPQLVGVSLFLEENASLLPYAREQLPYTQLPAGMELPYNRNFLQFQYSGFTAFRQQEVVYRYRLKGQGNNWTDAGTRREAIFTNIKPGEYTFQLQATRKGRPWPQEKVSYSFTVNAPYWKTWWFILTVSVVVIGLSFLFVRDRLKRIKQRLKLEKDLREMERKALRLQMNPHFIFNALDSISSFIFKDDPKQAVRYLNNFAKLMRLTLESSMEYLHAVETEVSILKNYLELEKLRFGDKFDYEIEVGEEIDYNVSLPPMLIQPHVENAILHGLKPKESGQGFLSIRFKLKEEMLVCEIEDNGIGRKKAREMPRTKDHRSMATQINKDRLRLLRSSLNRKVDLQIEDKYTDDGEAVGTKVVVTLPAEEF